MQVFVVFAKILILSLIALMDLCQSYWQIAKLVCLPASLSAGQSVICLWPLLFSICNCQWTNKRLGQQTGLAQALARQFVKFVDDLISPTQHGYKNNIVTQYIQCFDTLQNTHTGNTNMYCYISFINFVFCPNNLLGSFLNKSILRSQLLLHGVNFIFMNLKSDTDSHSNNHNADDRLHWTGAANKRLRQQTRLWFITEKQTRRLGKRWEWGRNYQKRLKWVRRWFAINENVACQNWNAINFTKS